MSAVFDWAVIRVVPRPERGEQLNVAVVLLCGARAFLGVRTCFDRARLAAIAPDLDLELQLPDDASRVKALGRVVREAVEVGWPYIGYGVEFLYVLDDSRMAIGRLVDRESTPPRGTTRVARVTGAAAAGRVSDSVPAVTVTGAATSRANTARPGRESRTSAAPAPPIRETGRPSSRASRT